MKTILPLARQAAPAESRRRPGLGLLFVTAAGLLGSILPQVHAADSGAAVLEWKPERYKLLTPEQLATLPQDTRAAWEAYLRRSAERAQHEHEVLAAECQKASLPGPKPAPGRKDEFELDSDTPPDYFRQEATQRLAQVVQSYQTPTGGWSKAVDYTAGPRQPGTHWTSQKGDAWHYCGTIDNRTTTEQIKLLAGVTGATGDATTRAAAVRGLEYLLEAQYPNGGWPQNYPVESGYHEAITLNDNAMIHVLEVLLAAAQQRPLLAPVVDAALAARCQAAVERGLACLDRMQVVQQGQRTVWCAQHHPLTLAPVRARAKEPPSLSGGESVEVVRFFMRQAPVTAESQAIVTAALKWFDTHRLTGLRKVKTAEGKTDYIDDASSTEVYWARFYDLNTGKPIFAGAQDGIEYATFREMAAKNKVAYDFMTTRPAELLTKDAERWTKRVTKESPKAR